jgi:peptidoglycan hydrolase CwlO-like protein
VNQESRKEQVMDKETLHRILVHPTRTGLDKVEKEVARLNEVNDVLRQELVTWKDAVAARNETIKLNNEDIAELHDRIETLNEDRRVVNRAIKEDQRRDAIRVDRIRVSVQAAHSCLSSLATQLLSLNGSLGELENEVCETRNNIAGDVEIGWAKELSHESDDTDTE